MPPKLAQSALVEPSFESTTDSPLTTHPYPAFKEPNKTLGNKQKSKVEGANVEGDTEGTNDGDKDSADDGDNDGTDEGSSDSSTQQWVHHTFFIRFAVSASVTTNVKRNYDTN